MDYSYLQERQESRSGSGSAPENGRGHPQNQYPVHCEHQPYPAGVMPGGYPTLGYGPYLHSIQGLGPPTSPGLASQESVIPSRVLVQDSSSTSGGSRGPSQRRPDYENVHSGAMQVQSSPMQFRPDTASSQHNVQLQHVLPAAPPQTNLPSPDAGFHIDGAAGAQGGPPKTSSGREVISSASTVTSGIHHHAKRKQATTSHSSQDKARVHMSEPVSHVPEPPAKRSRPQAVTPQLSTKGCQTEPLFEEVDDSNGTRAPSPDLPDGFGYVEMIGKKNKLLGVMVTRDVREGEEFGPFTGEFVKEGLGSVNPSTWEICVRGKTRFYINGGSDPNNWMTRVQVARCKEEQNLEAFQCYGDIFFRTTKAVKAGTELRVFYSKDYSRKVGFKADLEDLVLDQGSKRFECRDCRCHYTNAKSLLRHIKFEHDKENCQELSRKDADTQAQDEVRTSKAPVAEKKWIEKGVRRAKKVKGQNERTVKKKARPDNSLTDLQVKIVSSRKTKESKTPRIKSEVVYQFACDICQKPFQSEGHLEAHMAFHVEAKVSKNVCTTCGLDCKNTRVLKQHVISHDPDAYRCHICKKYFRRKSRIVAHLRYDHNVFVGKKWARPDLNELMNKQQDPDSKRDEDAGGEKEIKSVKLKPTCEECGEEFEDMESLEKHSASHGKGDFQCQYCSKKFLISSKLIAHFRQDHKIFLWKKHGLRKNMDERLARLILPSDQTNESHEESEPFHPELPKDMLGKRIVQDLKLPKVFKCKYCPKTYTNFGRVIRHEKQVHTNSGEYMCEFCSAMFVKETQYILHKRKHTKDRPFKCEECPLSFGSESAREKHMAEHRGECPFKCDVCGKRYRTRKCMMTHKRKQHQVPKQLYPCSFCGRPFKDKGARKKHENCHRGIRPHVCFTCGKAFRNAHTLKCHTLTHTGEKPYECRECQRRFRLPHQLNVHMVIHERAKRAAESKRDDGAQTSQGSGQKV